MPEYQGKQHIVLKFIHEEKHIVFNDIGKSRRKKKIHDEIKVIIALIA